MELEHEELGATSSPNASAHESESKTFKPDPSNRGSEIRTLEEAGHDNHDNRFEQAVLDGTESSARPAPRCESNVRQHGRLSPVSAATTPGTRLWPLEEATGSLSMLPSGISLLVDHAMGKVDEKDDMLDRLEKQLGQEELGGAAQTPPEGG